MGTFKDWLAKFTPFVEADSLSDEYDLKKIAVDNITGNPYQPRTHIDEDRLQELANSIEQHGVITPIQVTETDNDQYQLIAGERRVRACRMLDKSEIPALIRDLSDEQIIEVSFLENLQREPMNPVDEATMYRRLRNEFKNLSLEELGDLIGKSVDEIKENEWILDLSSLIQQALAQDLFDTDIAKTLQELDSSEQKQFITFVAQEDPDKTIMQEKIRELSQSAGRSLDGEDEDDINETLENELGIPGELQERAD